MEYSGVNFSVRWENVNLPGQPGFETSLFGRASLYFNQGHFGSREKDVWPQAICIVVNENGWLGRPNPEKARQPCHAKILSVQQVIDPHAENRDAESDFGVDSPFG